MCDCSKLHSSGGQTKSGVYTINLNDGKGEFNVFCDMNLRDGGWTVIQRRVGDSVSFNRTRDEYNVGFGDFNGSFWLGLEKMKRITDKGTYELYVGLESFSEFIDPVWQKYNMFSLGTDDNDYTLTVSDQTGYEGTAGDSLYTPHHGKKFTTSDEDNDLATENCGETHNAGWWYSGCRESHLNGVYYAEGATTAQDRIVWNSWLDETPLKTVVMAIRPA